MYELEYQSIRTHGNRNPKEYCMVRKPHREAIEPPPPNDSIVTSNGLYVETDSSRHKRIIPVTRFPSETELAGYGNLGNSADLAVDIIPPLPPNVTGTWGLG